MSNFLFKQGYAYVAGVDKPAILSRSMIVNAVTDMGFRVLYADECERTPVFPFRVPGRCGDQWDWVGFAERTGPTKSIDVPSRVKWIQEIPKPQVAQPVPGQPAPAPVVEPPPPVWESPEARSAPTNGGTQQAAFGGSGNLLVPALIGAASGWFVVKLVFG